MMGGERQYSVVAHIERFNEYLMRAVVEGRGCKGCGSWVDHATTIAIEKVAAAHPNPDSALIRAARAEFAKELDGTHAAEGKAMLGAYFGSRYSEWPQTPFADSVKTAFDHALKFVIGPWAPEELGRAREALDSAVAAGAVGAQLSRQTLIVGLLRLMIDAVEVVPDYDIGQDTSEQPEKRFAQFAGIALKCLVKFVEEPEGRELDVARMDLNAAAGHSSRSSTRSRDFGIILEHLRLILDGLERVRGR